MLPSSSFFDQAIENALGTQTIHDLAGTATPRNAFPGVIQQSPDMPQNTLDNRVGIHITCM